MMEIVCQQPGMLRAHQRAVENIRIADMDGKMLFLGVPGNIEDTEGEFVLQFKQEANRCAGILLYLPDTFISADKVADLDGKIKYFIDGIEKALDRNVLIVGGPTDKQRNADKYLVAVNRWPKREAPDTEFAILTNEQKEVS